MNPRRWLAAAGLAVLLGGAAWLLWTRRSAAPDEPAGSVVYRALGNQPLRVESEDAPAVRLALSPAKPDATVWDEVSTLGGAVQGLPGGGFLYQPRVGPGRVRDRFLVHIQGRPYQVEIEIEASLWYVDNSAEPGGDGRRQAPFDRLKQAEAASGPGDWICVLAGDGTSAGLDEGIRLKDGQSLIGQGSQLTLQGNRLTPDGPRPEISAPSGPAVRLGDGNRISSLRIRSFGDGLRGEGVDGAEIEDLEVSAANGSAVALLDCRGTLALRRLSLSGAGGLRLERNSGTVEASDVHYR